MRAACLIDIIGWSAILLWIALSGWFAWNNNAEWFQAVGVIGIAAAVGYFVLQRHAPTHPFGSIQSNANLYRLHLLTSDAAARALANTAILAKAIELDAKKRGDDVPPAIIDLVSIPMDQIDRSMSPNTLRYQAKLDVSMNAKLDANAKVESQRRASELLQAIVVILGTLQSGLGSFFLTALHKGAN